MIMQANLARRFHVRILKQYLLALDPSVIRNLLDVIDVDKDNTAEEDWKKDVWAEMDWAISTINVSRLAMIEAEIRKVLP
jgi:hypothetical protein